ncbi:MAG: PAS domain S-box protein [Terriglobales bacterium]|jgi:PAS domain S-box-containing protein
MRFFQQLLSSDFMPHGFCYLWDPRIVWLHVISDGLIALSYYCIPLILVYFIRKNRELPFNRIFWMFGTFILACGTTHLMEIWNVWHGTYLLAGVIKAITAAVSVLTAAMLIPLAPRVISLPGRLHLQEVNCELEREIAEYKGLDAPIEGPLRRRVMIGFTVALLLTILLGFSSWRGARLAADDADWVAHSYAVMDMLALTSKHVIEVETSARTFALTGREPLLTHYEAARGTVAQDEDALRHLTADNRDQQLRLDVLDPQVRAALDLAESMVAKRRQTRALSGADDILETERLMDAVRVTTQEMRAEELQLLSQRTLKTKAGRRLTSSIIVVGIFVGAGLLALARLAVSREIDVSARARAQIITLNAELEQRVEQRTAALESEITVRRRAEAVSERLAAVVESSDDAIISKTLDGTIATWNPGAEKLFGYSSSEAVGKPMGMLIPPERADEEYDILARIGGGESIEHFETVRVRKDGKTIDVSVTISPIRDNGGAIVGASKIARDITERKLAQDALRESDARRRFALETAKLGDWELDLATLQATRSLLHDQIFGYRSLLPEWSFDIFLRHVHPDDREWVRENFQSCVSQRKRWDFECRVVWPNGDMRWIWACGDHYRDLSGDATRMFGIVEDITERKRVEEALREQSQVMDSAQVFVRDMESRVVFWPRGAEKLYGFNSQEALGILSHDLFHTQFPEPLEMIEQKLFGTGMWEGELIHRKRDGSTIVVSSAWALHRDRQGRPVRILETNTDITARKLAEKKIQELNDELELRVAARTVQLETVNQELEAFSYSVSHDLRAPLRHIGGFSKMLVEEFGSTLDPAAQHYLDRIQTGTQKMGLLVDELLNLARVGRHVLHPQPTGLSSIVAEVIAMLQPETEGRQVQWIVADLPAVECDPILVKQVFQNLLANALKFTRPRVLAVIEVSHKKEEGQPVFMVRDNGVGFSMKYVDKLFGVFQRLHSAEDFEGTGIGLVTVQRIVHKHGGRVWAEGEPDKGAAFYFTLGVEKQAESKSNGATAGGQS